MDVLSRGNVTNACGNVYGSATRKTHFDRTENRKPSEKILVSWADPESVFGLDKFKVYRPLYNVQLMRDLDSPLDSGLRRHRHDD